MKDIYGSEIINDKTEDEKDYKRAYKEMQLTFVQRSIGMKIIDVLKLIEEDKSYIFDFIMLPPIQRMIMSIKGCYQINKDEAEDCAIFSITEYFYENNLNLDNFNESTFLNRFRSEIGKRVQKMMREGYSYKEVAVDFKKKIDNEELVFDNFEDEILEKIDLNVAFNKLPLRSQRILEMRFYDNMNQSEIAKEMNLSRNRISEIISESCLILKEYMNN